MGAGDSLVKETDTHRSCSDGLYHLQGEMEVNQPVTRSNPKQPFPPPPLWNAVGLRPTLGASEQGSQDLALSQYLRTSRNKCDQEEN